MTTRASLSNGAAQRLKRRRQLDTEAIAAAMEAQQPEPAPAPDKPKAARKSTTTRPKAERKPRGTRPADPPQGTRSLSLNIGEELRQDARAAYVAQFQRDGRGGAQTSFARWLGACLAAFAKMPTDDRLAAMRRVPDEDVKTPRTYHLPSADVEAVDEALAETPHWTDDQGKAHLLSYSAFARAALLVAVEQARAAAGGELVRVGGRLPSMPA